MYACPSSRKNLFLSVWNNFQVDFVKIEQNKEFTWIVSKCDFLARRIWPDFLSYAIIFPKDSKSSKQFYGTRFDSPFGFQLGVNNGLYLNETLANPSGENCKYWPGSQNYYLYRAHRSILINPLCEQGPLELWFDLRRIFLSFNFFKTGSAKNNCPVPQNYRVHLNTGLMRRTWPTWKSCRYYEAFYFTQGTSIVIWVVIKWVVFYFV